jgi:Tol biopolymer transport system component
MIRNASLAICVWLSSLAVAGEPEIFAPGVISGPADDAAPTFTPDGKTVYFFRHNGDDYDILESHLRARQWTVPVIAPFSGRWRDLEPAMAPDGSYMIFASSRPPAEGGKAIDGSWNGTDYPGKGGNLWRVDRDGQHWSKPVRLPDTINRSNAVFSPSIAADGTLYYMEASGEGHHWHLLHAALRDGRYQSPQALPFTVDAYRDVDPAVAPDQSYIVFSSNRPPSPSGRSDLFIAFRKNGQWGEPVYLPETINGYGRINESRLGPDGYTLYFSSQFIVSAVYPKDVTAARKGLADMESWNNGSDNIWRIDIRPYLQHRD